MQRQAIAGLYLGNGRSIFSVGLWFGYQTNTYHFHDEDAFGELMKEKADTVSKSFTVIYGLIQYLSDKNPTPVSLDKILSDQQSVDLNKSEIIARYMSLEITEEAVNAVLPPGTTF